MWEGVELREIRVFLMLAEELHFGHSAERLGLTQARVSQSLRELERKLGQQLVHRTSRRVTLTPIGEKFQALIEPVYDQLNDVLERVHADSDRLEGTLRIGLVSGPSAGPRLMAIIDRFTTRHPGCEVDILDVSLGDILGPIRRGEVDVLAVRLPIDQPDLMVGPKLSSEPRVLAVARDHPLAQRDQVSIEDLADYKVAWCDGLPAELEEAFVPHETPSGRPIERLRRRPIRSFSELAVFVARGQIVHPTVPSMSAHWGHPGIVYVPIADMQEWSDGLVWLRRNLDPKVRELVRIASDLVQDQA